MMIPILKARDIAQAPQNHTAADRQAAFRSLHASADMNKDRTRADPDRRLAQKLWDSVGPAEGCDHA